MKIAHISIYPEKDKKHSKGGGVASYTKNLITNIPYQKNDQVFILCNKIEGRYDKYEEDGITVVRCFDKSPKFIYQVLKEVKNIKPDTIHIQQELALYGNIITAYLLQWLILFLHRYNTIITLHGVISIKNIDQNFVKENNSSLPAWLVKLAFIVIYKPLCLFSKTIIVHEKVFKDILVKEYGINSYKINVIPHGIEDLKTIDKNRALDELDLPKKKDIVLFMGYLTGYKGLDLLIEGFSEYLKINKNAYLIIGAGKHPKLYADPKYLVEYNRIKDKAEQYIGLDNHRWEGFIEEQDIKYYYSASDISIYPYTNQLSSSGPMSLAIGFEKPFLASEVFDNFIENKDILFQKNPNSLKDSLIEFFKNKESFIKYIQKLKTERLWSTIGKGTYNYYKGFNL